MAYKVIADAVTVPRAVSSSTDRDTGETTYDNVSTTYLKDMVIADDDVSPVVQKLYEDGDPHVTSLLVKLSEEEEKEADVEKAQEARLPSVTGPESASPGRILVDGAAQEAAAEVVEQEGGGEESAEGTSTEEPAPAEQEQPQQDDQQQYDEDQ